MSSKCLIIFLFLVTCDYNTGQEAPGIEAIAIEHRDSFNGVSRLSSQAIENRDLAPDDNLRKRSHSDDLSGKRKKAKIDEEWSDGKPEENANGSGVGDQALISDKIRNQIEQQVHATVASHFGALQTKMNNVEDKMKQLLEAVRKSSTASSKKYFPQTIMITLSEAPVKQNPAGGGNIEDLSPSSPQAAMTCSLKKNQGCNIEDLSLLSSQAIEDRDLAPDDNSRKRSHSDDLSGKRKKAKGGPSLEALEDEFWHSAETPVKQNPAGGAIGSNTLITREIKDHIEEQVKATVASYFEEQVKAMVGSYFEALQTEMNNNIEEQFKAMVASYYEARQTEMNTDIEQKVDKSKKGGITANVKKLFKK